MIQASELRIGNWVRAGKMTEPLQVYSIDFNTRDRHLINGATITYNDLHPIPLTPEILIACGFETDEYTYWKSYSIEGQFFYFSVGHFKGDIFKYLPKNSPSTLGIEIKSLHQLMNIHFALTNTELNYKP